MTALLHSPPHRKRFHTTVTHRTCRHPGRVAVAAEDNDHLLVGCLPANEKSLNGRPLLVKHLSVGKRARPLAILVRPRSEARQRECLYVETAKCRASMLLCAQIQNGYRVVLVACLFRLGLADFPCLVVAILVTVDEQL